MRKQKAIEIVKKQIHINLSDFILDEIITILEKDVGMLPPLKTTVEFTEDLYGYPKPIYNKLNKWED